MVQPLTFQCWNNIKHYEQLQPGLGASARHHLNVVGGAERSVYRTVAYHLLFSTLNPPNPPARCVRMMVFQGSARQEPVLRSGASSPLWFLVPLLASVASARARSSSSVTDSKLRILQRHTSTILKINKWPDLIWSRRGWRGVGVSLLFAALPWKQAEKAWCHAETHKRIWERIFKNLWLEIIGTPVSLEHSL